MFHREEFRRVTAGEIGDIDFSPRVVEHYTGDVVQAFGLRRTDDHHVKLVLDLSYGAASFVMPNLLSKVGADVLSINPYAQTPGVIAIDRVVSEARVAEAVRGSGADLGAVIDPGGERLTLIDGLGRVLTDDETIMAFIGLGAEAGDTRKVALPVTASGATLRYCAELGIEVALAPLSASGLLETAASGGVTFASDRRGGYVFPSFLPAFDAAAALARLLSLLGRGASSLEERLDSMPAMPIVHEEVVTPGEQKGLIMRTLMEQLAEQGADLVLVDGIKVQADDGWALVVPDPEDPVTHVWAEGIDLPGSVALATAYVERITALADN
jgi:mannose-1-phosphate guanylyltransferase/phosphomannomutase